jgi:hypothetical protein
MPQTVLVCRVPTGFARLRRWHVALLLGLALSLGFVPRAQAVTTWTVCASGCDYASIKAAIAAPTTLDGDTLAIAAGTYTEAGIMVDKSLTLQGEDRATTIVQAAATRDAATDRVFTIASGVTVTLQELTIRYGHTAGLGGGVHNAGTLTLSHSTVHSNKAHPDGGGVYNAGTLTLTHSTVRGNAAPRDGGGIRNAGTLTLTHSTVRGNTATSPGGRGGGVFNSGTLTLTHSTVSDNTAGNGGGLNNGNTLTLTHSTVSGNAATNLGGGLDNRGRLTLTHSTVSGNTALNSGGLGNTGRLTLTNSIIANHPSGGDCSIGGPGSITSKGYNLDSDGSCQLTAATDQPGTDPLLGPLQDNGGPTRTHALLPGRPAIDAIPWDTNGCGTTYVDDQRGQARPQPAGRACDIGAYEVEVDG